MIALLVFKQFCRVWPQSSPAHQHNFIFHSSTSKSITPFCYYTIAVFPQQELLIDSSNQFSSISSGWLSCLVFLVGLLYQNLLSSTLINLQELEIMKASVIHLCRWINQVIITEKMSLHAVFSHLPFFLWWCLSCNKFCMLEMVCFLKNTVTLTKLSSRMVAHSIAVTAMMADLVLHYYYFMDEVMPWWQQKSSWWGSVLTWNYFWPVDTDMFFTNARCNATVPQLNWYK